MDSWVPVTRKNSKKYFERTACHTRTDPLFEPPAFPRRCCSFDSSIDFFKAVAILATKTPKLGFRWNEPAQFLWSTALLQRDTTTGANFRYQVSLATTAGEGVGALFRVDNHQCCSCSKRPSPSEGIPHSSGATATLWGCFLVNFC